MSDAAYEEGSPFPVLDKPLQKFYEGWPRTPWVVVVHYSAGYNAGDCYKTLGSRGLSVHCTIERDGAIWKHVADGNRAIHAGYGRWGGCSNMNHHALGFEIANLGWIDGELPEGSRVFMPAAGKEVDADSDQIFYRDETWTDSSGTTKTSRIGTKTECSKHPDHRDDWSDKLWSDYPEAQLEAVFWIIWKWSEAFGILPENIIGHEHVTPHRKQDPGPAFPWSKLKAYLEERYRESLPEMLDVDFKRKERVKAVQSHLSRLGLPVGDVDGIWGRNTQAAANSAVALYGNFYGFGNISISPDNCYELACALRLIPGFDPGRV